jgi:hypothetical protein
MTIHMLSVALSAAATRRVTFTLYDNGNTTALACVVPEGGTMCSDTSDSVPVAAGDELSLAVNIGLSKTAFPGVTAGISLELDPAS